MVRLVQWVLSIGLLVALCAGFYRYLHTSPVFAVQWIRVERTHVLDPQVVLQASGITTANNLFSLDLPTTRKAVEALPYVKTCGIDRVFPNKVVLVVTERTPVATLLWNSRSFELDAEAVVLRELMPDAEHPGPLITNVGGLDSPELGMCLRETPAIKALEVWQAFMRTPVAQAIAASELAAFSDNEIIMFCDELPFEIRWGRDDAASQARRLNILWSEKRGEIHCKEYLDLRFGDDLICK